MLLLLPVLTAVAAARRWPHVGVNFYAGTSQVMATLFVAMALELFVPDKPVWENKNDRFLILALMAVSSSGLFACLRATLPKWGQHCWPGSPRAG
jgi:hypothetical protein